MGSGIHGGFGQTKGRSAMGSADISFMNNKDDFMTNIRKRKDIDPDGKFDLIAHGTPDSIEIEHNGQTEEINSRVTARLIKQLKGYKGQDIRLLSCETGATIKGFAQSLANKLNVNVYAPNYLLWANPDGTHFVAPRDKNKPDEPDKNIRGRFIKFKPGGNKQ